MLTQIVLIRYDESGYGTRASKAKSSSQDLIKDQG